MKFMITGSRGFVGAATKDYLDHIVQKGNSHPCQALDYDLMDGLDIRDANQLKEFAKCHRPDRILHLAAIARFADADKDPLLAWQTNVLGTQNVVDVAARYHIPLVYASTGSAIMPLDEFEPPYKEFLPARGNSVYGCSKALGECIVRQHTPHIILRYAHLYGAEKRHHGLIGGFLDRIGRGLQPRLFGGRQSNDFVYIKDVARINYLALASSWDRWNQTFNVGSGQELSTEQAGEIICRVAGYTGAIERLPARTVDPGRFIFDTGKAAEWLGFEAEFDFESGLADMMGKAEKAGQGMTVNVEAFMRG